MKGENTFEDDDWVIIKKFSWREKTKVRGNAIKVDVKGQSGAEAVIDMADLQFYSVVYGIKDASFMKSIRQKNGHIKIDDKIEFINNDVEHDYDPIFKEINKFNNLDDLKAMQKK